MLTDIGKNLMLQTFHCSMPPLKVSGGRKTELSLLQITCVAVAFGEVFYPRGLANQTTCSTVNLKKKTRGVPAH